MKLSDVHIIRIFFLFVGTTVFTLNTLNAQDTTYVDVLDFFEVNKVQWVDQIPPINKDVKKKRKGWLKRLIFGKKDIPGLQKPVHAIPLNEQETLVIDQGNGTLFFAEEEKLDIPKIVRKQNGKFSSMVSACLLPNGDLLFTDSRLSGIFKLTADRKTLKPFNQSELLQPTGIAYCEKTNQIWVVETGSHRISILDTNGNRVKTFGERGAEANEFNYPTYIWVDHNGTAYVVDALNYRIQLFDKEGNFISMFGQNGNGTGYFASPKGIATDSHGHIYIVDALFHGVQVFDQKGNYLYQFGKQGRQTSEFWMPSGIYIDKNNLIYVADSYNSRVQIFQLEFK